MIFRLVFSFLYFIQFIKIFFIQFQNQPVLLVPLPLSETVLFSSSWCHQVFHQIQRLRMNHSFTTYEQALCKHFKYTTPDKKRFVLCASWCHFVRWFTPSFILFSGVFTLAPHCPNFISLKWMRRTCFFMLCWWSQHGLELSPQSGQ